MGSKSNNSRSVQLGSCRPAARLPPLRALQAFEAVSRHATFAQAAAELGVTPSAVSHQIQVLEDFLGVMLFRREGGRRAMSDVGRVYAREIGTAFGLMSSATNLVAPQPLSGPLVIASSPSFAAKWLQPRLPAFLAAYPGVKVRLFTFSNQESFDRERCDIAIAYGRPPAIQSENEPLLIERLRPLCSPGLVVSLGLRSPRDLVRATLIHSLNALTWAEYLRRIGSGDVRPGNELWLNPSSIAIDAAVAGQGVILESELLAERELRDGRLVAPFDGDEFGVDTSSYFLVRPAGSKNGAQVRQFESWLRPLMALSSRVRGLSGALQEPGG